MIFQLFNNIFKIFPKTKMFFTLKVYIYILKKNKIFSKSMSLLGNLQEQMVDWKSNKTLLHGNWNQELRKGL